MGLTGEQVEQFERDGYLLVPELFRPDELLPLRREIDGLVDRAARRLASEGKLAQLHEEEPFTTRLGRLIDDAPEAAPDLFRAIEGKGGGGHAGAEMFRILAHPRLLDTIESLTGPEIVASSVYRIRPKAPRLGRGVVPWHQDSGYFSAHCDDRLIVTCWLPLVDATPENGCLQVLPRAHGSILPHHTGGNAGFLVIEDGDLPPEAEPVTVPVPLGGVLLLSNLTPHRSTPNRSDVVRWSVDLRYQSADLPNNVDQTPADFDPDAGPESIACYPPEADFYVRSRRHPEKVIATPEAFAARRRLYEEAALPGPNRGWTPVGGRP